ncbi:MAG: phage terminase large subunit family protein, partial [Deltaproteobacteria bacterium]|nr:phage terminase large subunit family protein [Deltaproteobacteria bacterium]
FDYHVRCPACRAYQVMEFDRIRWPEEERDPEKIESQNLAWYECKHCNDRWDDYRRDLAARRGQWRSRESAQALRAYLFQHRPAKIGFHIPSWLSHFVSLGEVAASFLKGLKDKNKLKDFMNKHKAEPWKDYTVERKEDRILALRDERYMGLVPSGGVISCLTAGVDTQDHGFYYEIRAWGWGMNLESWQVRFGFVETFGALKEILLDHRYKDVDGREYFVRLTVQDAMGHRTSDVYDFTRLNKGVIPFKGEQKLAQPHTWSKIDVYPGTTKPIPGGIRLLRADATFFKNQLARKLEINPMDPGAWHLCAEATEEYARQMCAEYQDEKGFWQCPENRPNHLWDCSYLNLVAADVLGVRFWKKPEEETERAEETGRKISEGRVVRSKFMSR